MTEAKWLASPEPELLLDHLGDQPTERKLLLSAANALLRIHDHYPIERYHRAAKIAESHADSDDESWKRDSAYPANDEAEYWKERGTAIKNLADDAFRNYWLNFRLSRVFRRVATAIAMKECWPAIERRCEGLVFDRFADEAEGHSDFRAIAIVEREFQADMLREIFGNPFRPPTVDPAWLTWNGGTIPGLALSIYQEKAFDRLPILADALEEAGCSDAYLLDHCRGESGHVPGCWALDALLGRS
jgi:hypothetical protein